MNNLYYEYCKSYNLTKENAGEFFCVIGELINSDEIQMMKQYEQHFEIDRLQHVTSVAYIT